MRNKLIYIVVVILSFFVGVIGTIYVIKYIPDNVVTRETERTVSVTEDNTIKSSIDKIYDAVVLVETYNNSAQLSSGTGFIYKKNDDVSFLITNHHVIEKGNKFKITLANKEEVDATVLGSDEYSDIAVLSIPSTAVTQVAILGESSKSEIGDTVFAVGSPLGKEYMGTVTKGILSGKDRMVTVSSANNNMMLEVLQTDTAINPGNSGGPLVNINGEVIGVNSMKLVQDEIEGMGFSIPIELVTALLERLENGEKIIRPLMGVEMTDVSNAYYLYRQGIVVPDDVDRGVVVINVTRDYPAEKAGLKKGDIILEINDVQINDSAHFKHLLYKYEVGSSVKIRFYRDKKIMEATVNLDKSAE
ncbi:MAG: trypsin-like peptidase domain-containing protein [Bacilli bacterium]|nr:trypsin-like peptidase domain-containing protein [Bacilli bacterium]